MACITLWPGIEDPGDFDSFNSIGKEAVVETELKIIRQLRHGVFPQFKKKKRKEN